MQHARKTAQSDYLIDQITEPNYDVQDAYTFPELALGYQPPTPEKPNHTYTVTQHVQNYWNFDYNDPNLSKSEGYSAYTFAVVNDVHERMEREEELEDTQMFDLEDLFPNEKKEEEPDVQTFHISPTKSARVIIHIPTPPKSLTHDTPPPKQPEKKWVVTGSPVKKRNKKEYHMYQKKASPFKAKENIDPTTKTDNFNWEKIRRQVVIAVVDHLKSQKKAGYGFLPISDVTNHITDFFKSMYQDHTRITEIVRSKQWARLTLDLLIILKLVEENEGNCSFQASPALFNYAI
jgi:hypothetical protein